MPHLKMGYLGTSIYAASKGIFVLSNKQFTICLYVEVEDNVAYIFRFHEWLIFNVAIYRPYTVIAITFSQASKAANVFLVRVTTCNILAELNERLLCVSDVCVGGCLRACIRV